MLNHFEEGPVCDVWCFCVNHGTSVIFFFLLVLIIAETEPTELDRQIEEGRIFAPEQRGRSQALFLTSFKVSGRVDK